LGRSAISQTFGVTSVPDIVQSVLSGEMPRQGFCSNGWSYFVHGVGFTVVTPEEGQIHMDGSPEGDCFSIYDMALFLETAEMVEQVDAAEVEKQCARLAELGEIIRLRSG